MKIAETIVDGLHLLLLQPHLRMRGWPEAVEGGPGLDRKPRDKHDGKGPTQSRLNVGMDRVVKAERRLDDYRIKNIAED